MAGTQSQQQPQHELGFRMVVAMELGRGIGWKQSLPWPFIQRDHDHYTRLSYTPRIPDLSAPHVSQWSAWDGMAHTFCKHKGDAAYGPGKKVIHVMGRMSFESTPHELLRKAFNIVISNTLKERPEHADGLVPDFDTGLRMASSAEVYDVGDDVWIMGGQKVYEEALTSAMCEKIYLTRIFNRYQSDSFMPEFENDWVLVKDPMIDDSLIEENGVTYQFEVYEPRHRDEKALV